MGSLPNYARLRDAGLIKVRDQNPRGGTKEAPSEDVPGESRLGGLR
jgi:hypothetical protein